MANVKFTGLTATSSVTDADIMAVAIDVATTPLSRKLTMANLALYIQSVVTTLTATVTISGTVTDRTPEDILILYRPIDGGVQFSTGIKYQLETGAAGNSTLLTEQMRYASGDDTSYQVSKTTYSNGAGDITHKFFGTVQCPYQGLETFDSVGTYTMTISAASTFTADRTLSFVTGDSDRQLTLNANVALNQNLETDDAVTFAEVTVSGTDTSTSYDTMQTWVRPTVSGGGGPYQALFQYNLKEGAVTNSTQLQAVIGYGVEATQEAYNIYSSGTGTVATTFTGDLTSGTISFGAGSVSAPSLRLANYTDSGFFQQDSDAIGVSSNGSLVAKFQTDGFEYIMPQRAISATETLSDDEMGTHVNVTATSAVDLTLPQQSTTTLPQGSFFELKNNGPEDVTFLKQGTDILHGNTTVASGGSAKVFLSKVSGGVNYWDVVGGTTTLLGSMRIDLPSAANGTYLVEVADKPGTLIAAYAVRDTGTNNLTVNINGSAVIMTTLAVSTTLATQSITSSNTFTFLDQISVTVSSNSGSNRLWVQLMYSYQLNLM